MDWINFFFPSIIPFQLQTDERFLDEFYDVFEERMNDSQFLCELYPPLGEVLFPALNDLCRTVHQCGFDFCSDSNSLKMFLSEQDCSRFIDCFFLDVISGTYLLFREELDRCVEEWAEEERNNGELVEFAEDEERRTTKTRPNIPKEAKRVLSKWFEDHVDNPYPTAYEKERLSIATELSIKKVENWFINERSRKWHLYRRRY